VASVALDEAVAAYNASIEEAVKDVAKPIQKQFDAASKQGQLDSAKRYKEALQAVAAGKLLPRLHDLNRPARESYNKAVRRAADKCSMTYDKAMREYTKAKDTVTADRVQKEHAEFLSHPSRRPLHVPAEAVGFRGHWYLFSQDALHLEPAIAAAQRYEGYLLVINDGEENAFIKPFVRDKVRLGLLRLGDIWMTSERKPASFLFWENGQPQNTPDQVSAAIHANGKWHDWQPEGMPYCVEWE